MVMSSLHLNSANNLNIGPRRYHFRRPSPQNSRKRGQKHSTNTSLPPPSSSNSSAIDIRPVLVPLHPNLRRLPSRLNSTDKHSMDICEPEINPRVGSKRKRVASAGNENAQHGHGRPTRGSGRLKRFKASRRSAETSEDERSSSMEVDSGFRRYTRRQQHQATETDDDGEEEQSEQDEDQVDESSDDYLISSASLKSLLRLRKDDLVRLYNLAGLTDDAESYTKPDLANAIINSREDVASLPPSSPLGRGAASASGSSDYSSDDAIVPDDDEEEEEEEEEEQTQAQDSDEPTSIPTIRRRVTTNQLVQKTKRQPLKSRSLSMGHLNDGPSSRSRSRRQTGNKSADSNSSTGSRRRSSPSSSRQTQLSVSSPPAHHLRSRKISAPTLASIPSPTLLTDPDTLPTPIGLAGSGSTPTAALAAFTFNTHVHRRGKSKQVEFEDPVVIKTPSKKSTPGYADAPTATPISIDGSESDLTELEELEERIGTIQPSPRRLRSKDKERKPQRTQQHQHESTSIDETDDIRRVTPMRNAKRKMKSMKEDDTETDGEQEEEEEEEEGGNGDDEDDIAEEDEVDELVSNHSASASPAQSTRRTPMRRRLRSLNSRRRSVDDPSDGDDEDEGEEDEVDEVIAEEGEEEEQEEEEDDEETIAVEPRKLRNGKIVGEEDVDMDEDEGEEENEEENEEEDEEDVAEGEEIDVDVDEEEAEEGGEEGEEGSVDLENDAEDDTEEDDDEVEMEDEDSIDLSTSTLKTLVRLRRDDLVKLCESRDLEPAGTKPQLAEALLQWRDNQASMPSSSVSSSGSSRHPPSSTATARPLSTPTPTAVKQRRRNNRSGGKKSSQKTDTPAVPVLLRSNRVHEDEPLTPLPQSSHATTVNGTGSTPRANGGNTNEPELELDLESLGLDDREIPPEKLTKLEKIGSGGFKDVFIGKYKTRGGPKKVAIAEFRGQLSTMDIKELKLLGGFDHPNIVRFIGVSIPENTRDTPVMIVSELCTNGDLFDYIRNTNPPSLHKVLSIMLDIARGLEYLHLRKPSIIHRDCKSSNILITSKGNAKIADFGLAKVKQSTRSMVRSLVGTVNWQAPELWHAHPKYNHKVDVFSCACVYWEMLQWHVTTKKFPWEGMNEHAIYEQVGTKRQRPSLSGLRKQWCPEIVELVERMWAQEHQDRPTMSEVVEVLEELVQKY